MDFGYEKVDAQRFEEALEKYPERKTLYNNVTAIYRVPNLDAYYFEHGDRPPTYAYVPEAENWGEYDWIEYIMNNPGWNYYYETSPWLSYHTKLVFNNCFDREIFMKQNNLIYLIEVPWHVMRWKYPDLEIPEGTVAYWGAATANDPDQERFMNTLQTLQDKYIEPDAELIRDFIVELFSHESNTEVEITNSYDVDFIFRKNWYFAKFYMEILTKKIFGREHEVSYKKENDKNRLYITPKEENVETTINQN